MTWLTLALVLVPLVGAGATALVRQDVARQVALLAALVALGAGVAAAVAFGRGEALDASYAWFPALGSDFSLSLDGMGVVMALLTLLLVPVVLVAEWKVERAKSYAALVLLLEALALLVFLTGDVLVFYVAFEATLIPMYFLIGGWGSDKEQARRAALKFLLFGLAGGLVLLFGVVGIAALSTGVTPDGAVSLDIATLAGLDLGGSTLAKVTFAACFVAFALKAPM
ncbi:MAG: NADH-quinone oxidoreductase subunit M, partial [Propionibacteriaceae bacterium]|nr:NADH-quinone oxidoreductase subunit M [Propionibacteriaceae bacterium]